MRPELERLHARFTRAVYDDGPERSAALTMTRLLVVEDESNLAAALDEGLRSHGFHVSVAHSAEEAWNALWSEPFDVVILDVMLPEGRDAGFTLAQEMRESDLTQPILFLSARETLPDRVRGLEVGEDYLPKPFALAELVARVRALRRRGDIRPDVVRWRGVDLEPMARRVTRDGRLVRLTGKEYEVTELLLLNPGRVFTRAEILERIWGLGFETDSNLLDVYVRNIRAKLGEDVVETVRGVGYRFPG